jgi:transcriptional regulator with XRE-family HTH domain
MKLNEQIKSRREELGLSDVDVARASGLTIDSYCDIESYSSELLTLVPLRNVKQLCTVLGVNLLDLLGVSCAFCEQPVPFQDYQSPRNELVRQHRAREGWSLEELFGRFKRMHWAEVEQELETNPDQLENWRLDMILELAEILRIPPQVLLGVRCPKCSR